MESYKNYHAYNLTIQSEIPLSLPEKPPKDQPDIIVRLGSPAEPKKYNRTDDGVEYAFGDNSLLLRWSSVGSFYIDNGQTILFNPAEDLAHASLPQVPLLGTVMAVAMFQRGMTTLHGSSIAVGNKAVIFLANKGRGKSTLAAYCLGQGHQLISDDICAIEDGGGGSVPYLNPSFSSVKLWPDAMDHLHLSGPQHEKIHPALEKRKVIVQENFAESATEVGAIALLEYGHELSMEKIAGHAAIPQLLPHLLINRFPEDQPPKEQERVFLQVARLLQSVPMYMLYRPHNLLMLPQTLSLIKKMVL